MSSSQHNPQNFLSELPTLRAKESAAADDAERPAPKLMSRISTVEPAFHRRVRILSIQPPGRIEVPLSEIAWHAGLFETLHVITDSGIYTVVDAKCPDIALSTILKGGFFRARSKKMINQRMQNNFYFVELKNLSPNAVTIEPHRLSVKIAPNFNSFFAVGDVEEDMHPEDHQAMSERNVILKSMLPKLNVALSQGRF